MSNSHQRNLARLAWAAALTVAVFATPMAQATATSGGGNNGGGTNNGSDPMYNPSPSVNGVSFPNSSSALQGFSNGFNVSGQFNFIVTGDTGTATITYTVDDTVNTVAGVTYFDGQSLLGYFADSENLNQKPILSTYQATGGVQGLISDFTISAPGGPLPQDTNFPNQLNDLTSRASGTSSGSFIATGSSVTLQQTVTVTFTNLTAGDTIYAAFPNDESLTPAPGGPILLGSAGIALLGFGLLRRKRICAAV